MPADPGLEVRRLLSGVFDRPSRTVRINSKELVDRVFGTPPVIAGSESRIRMAIVKGR
ncbi:hypothetical protein [Micromonospora sp. RTGN7]|uniref:hypothetical protein n=1 Tax=Micromonospora sp. RTGN7 TaxID=3016526 RepID=UPI0029FED51C|nr:hypothetical protein [Micromonospora sp. RTGN7]